MTTFKLTKGQYEDFKLAALERYEDTFKETIKEIIDDMMDFEGVVAECITDELAQGDYIDNNLEKIINRVPADEIKKAIVNTIYDKLSR